jgi:hypothetical protein
VVHRDVEELRRLTRLRPDLYRYWFKFITIYPSDTYVCSNSLIDLGEAWRLEDVGWYHPDKSKSVAYHLVIPKDAVEQLSSPPSL